LGNLDLVTVSQTRRARAARKRKSRVAAADNDLTPAQWEAIASAWGGCAYCRAPASAGSTLQRDCVLPISRGGRYTLDNVVPACRSCNASKCNEEVTHWLRRKRLDEGAFLLTWREIQIAMAREPGRAPATGPAYG
jgi:5-methylcytosine-specific restriction endonuclease McrA